jgi:hypothetical protein
MGTRSHRHGLRAGGLSDDQRRGALCPHAPVPVGCLDGYTREARQSVVTDCPSYISETPRAAEAAHFRQPLCALDRFPVLPYEAAYENVACTVPRRSCILVLDAYAVRMIRLSTTRGWRCWSFTPAVFAYRGVPSHENMVFTHPSEYNYSS